MRRFLTTSLIILALAVSAAGSAPAAHAENAQEGEACEIGIGGCAIGLVCDAKGICQKDSGAIFGPAEPTQAEKDAVAKRQAEVDKAKEASWGFDWIMAKIMSLFALLVGIAALALNYAMYYTVVDMGRYINGLSSIGTVWKILRDIGNILIIFGFLAIGISIIIDSDWYGGGKKLLPTLLIAAVFANFSLFAAEAMIDVGNLFATQIYKQINEGNLPNPSDTSATTGFAYVIQNKGVAGVLMKKLGLPSIYGGMKDVDVDGKPLFSGGAPFYMSFMSIIVFIVVAFVMFALAFILVSRFIVLILLIMVSPVGIAGLAVPGLQGWANKWWHTLFQQTITAPILLLMLYIALSVIVDPKFLGFDTNAPAWNGIQTGHIINFAGVLLSYLIAMGLLLAVVYFAKTLSAVGAGWATKTAGALSFGATAWAGRTSGGWLANKAARGLRRTAVSRVPLVGTGVVRGLNRIATGSFDVRGVKFGGGLKGLGVETGSAQKGGYRADLKGRIESRTKYAADLKGRELTDNEKIRQAKAREDIKKLSKTYKEIGARWVVADDRRNIAIRELDGIRGNLTSEEYETRKNAINTPTKGAETELKSAKEALDRRQTELQEIESVTDAGAKRKYAKALNLWSNEKNTFNRVFNFAANTEAAKKIREEAKKSSADKTLDSLKNALKKITSEEEKPKEGEKPEEKQPESPKSGPSIT